VVHERVSACRWLVRSLRNWADRASTSGHASRISVMPTLTHAVPFEWRGTTNPNLDRENYAMISDTGNSVTFET